MPRNQSPASAIIGASRPEQVRDNVKAAGVKLDGAVIQKIDEVLGEAVVWDPKKTASPSKRP